MIFVDENIPLLADTLKDCCEIYKFVGRNLTNQHLKDYDCEFLFIRSTTKVNKELLDGTNVRFVASATSGIDHVDLDYLCHNNIFFADAKGSNANSVAEYVVFSALKWAILNHIKIEDKTIGIIGFGCIGRIVSKYFYDLGLKVIINDPPLLTEGYEFSDNYHYADLDQLLTQSDIITNHVPLASVGEYPTLNLISDVNIDCIKPGSLIIHSSRGGVIEESALLSAIINNKISAVIDVWKDEPLINKELAKIALLISPHVAGYSYDGKLKGTLDLLNAYEEFTGNETNKGNVQSILSRKINIAVQEYDDIERLYIHLLNSREFERDSDNLIRTLDFPDELRAKEFDRQRKEYPKRRESLIITK